MSSNEQIILDRIIDLVNRTAPDSEIYLYGSRARQNAKKISDWDENHSITPLFENYKLVLTLEQALDSLPEQAPGNMTLGSRFASLPGSIRL